ncbi:MAG: outer membrane protein assembly factor BamD [Candidatus Acidiferrales bacterium]
MTIPGAKFWAALRSLLLGAAAASLLLLASPRAGAQVPTPQSGGSGENAPPPTPTAADKDAKKSSADTSAESARKKGKKHENPAANIDTTSEPDKILYNRAQADLKGGRFTEGRLALQTLINTYPDSEYLAKAKLAVADSYYKEGGTTNLTQSIQEYNDFQTFFPFLDEAAYAQMQIGLAHYKMMEKADRDKTQGEAAEDAFQAFLLKYPQSPLVPKAEQYLRDVQEVLADGQYKVAYFYYRKFDYRASAARLVELTDRYPLYSQNDDALWMLGDIYERAKQASKNEDDKNHWGDLAAKCYAKIVRDYPLSKLAPDAKVHLKAMGKSVPSADPDAVVRMQKQQMYEKEHHQSVVMKLPLGMIKGSPDVSTAAHTGTPQMNPPNDVVSATDILRPGAAGPSFTVAGGTTGRGTSDNSSGNGNEIVTPEDATTAPVGSNNDQTGVGVQIISTGEEAAPKTDAPPPEPAVPEPGTTVQPAPKATGPADAPAAANGSPSAPEAMSAGAAAAGSSSSSTAAGATDPAGGATNSSKAPPGQPVAVAPGSSSTTAAQSSSGSAKAPAVDSSQESTSKKKKGLKKLIPW